MSGTRALRRRCHLQLARPVEHETAVARSVSFALNLTPRTRKNQKPVAERVCFVLAVAEMRIAHDGNLRRLKQGARERWRVWRTRKLLFDLQLRGDQRGERIVEEYDVAVAEQHVVARLQRDCEPTVQSPPPPLVFTVILACSTRISSRGFLRTMALNSSLPNALCAKYYNWNTVVNKDTLACCGLRGLPVACYPGRLGLTHAAARRRCRTRGRPPRAAASAHPCRARRSHVGGV
jgi:hypothetical protein